MLPVIRTLVYGSCVSRDTFEFLQPHGFQLVKYIARQSIVSAGAPLPIEQLPDIHCTSAFQRRMLIGDWTGSLIPTLRRMHRRIDLILWDICDERLGFRLSDDGAFTRSVDSLSTGLDPACSSWPIHTFGAPSHFQHWTKHASKFVAYLDRLGLRHKTIVIAPPWAEVDDYGHRTKPSFGITARIGNARNRPYYDYLRDTTGLRHIGTNRSVTASSAHQWGAAPFHYLFHDYVAIADEIQSFTRTPLTKVSSKNS